MRYAASYGHGGEGAEGEGRRDGWEGKQEAGEEEGAGEMKSKQGVCLGSIEARMVVAL